MAETAVTALELKVLQQWDTPTICNGLELLGAEYRTRGSPSSTCSASIRRCRPSSGMRAPR